MHGTHLPSYATEPALQSVMHDQCDARPTNGKKENVKPRLQS